MTEFTFLTTKKDSEATKQNFKTDVSESPKNTNFDNSNDGNQNDDLPF